MVQPSHPYMTTGKPMALTIQTFVGKVMSLLFNLLSRFVIAFLSKEQVPFNFMTADTNCSDFGTQENKICHSCHFSSCILHEMMGLNAMILVSCMLSFKPDLSLSSFTFIKRLFSLSLLSAVRMVSSAHLRLLLSLPAVLISACILHDVFCIQVNSGRWQYTAFSYSFPNFDPVNCSMPSSNYCFLSCIQVS